MGVTLLGCFSILRFEIIKMNFEELVRNKDGLGASCLARRLWSDSKSDQPRMGVTLLGCFSILRFEIIKMNV